jgi:hypothetical protein
MARDGSGTYTRVSNTFSSPAAQTVISPTDAEAFFDDIETEINDSLSRSGKGGMSATAVLKLADGTSAAPALTFTTDTDTGIARTTANTMVVAASGVAQITITPTVTTFGSPITFPTTTITGLTNKASPNSADDYIIIYDNAGTAVKKATVGSVGSAGSVSSIAGNTGAFTLSNGITNSANDIQGVNATASTVGVVKRQRIAIVREEQTVGTAGGTFTAGSDATRTLNTEGSDLDGITSLASNRFTLQAGTWLIEWSAPAYKVGRHQSFLYNFTDTAEVERGTSENSASAGAYATTRSVGSAIVTIAGAKAFEIRHRCETTQAANGFGVEGSWSTEVYTEVKITSYDQ